MHRLCLISLLIFSGLLWAQSPQVSPQQLVDDAMQKQKAGDLAAILTEEQQRLWAQVNLKIQVKARARPSN